jgi:two-component system NtrC family sensor kinase
MHVGSAYSNSGDNLTAIKYYYEGLKYFYIAEAGKIKSEYGFNLESIFSFIGQAYLNENKIDSALKYLQKAYVLEEELNKNDHWPVPYLSMGKIFYLKGQYPNALFNYRKGISYSSAKQDSVDGYSGIAETFKQIGSIDSAIIYAKKSIDMAGSSSFIPQMINLSAILTDIYRGQHIIDSAFKYQGIMLAANDSLFSRKKIEQLDNLSYNEKTYQQKLETDRVQFVNRVKMYSLISVIFVFISIAILLWRNVRHKQKSNLILEKQKEKLLATLAELKTTQSQLIQSEKLASLGELTAGIAHEIQNPLNFMNNFSEVNSELIAEMKQEMENGNLQDAKTIANSIDENEQKINHHGKRADAIVKGMLQHSRSSSGVKVSTDINTLADEYLRLAYHGLRAKDNSFNASIQTDFDENVDKINIIPQDIGRVLLNLYNNGFYAVSEKKKQRLEGYDPIVYVSTRKAGNKVEIYVKDNGNGIPQKVKDKIFQPFFTTKPTGQGTGLGLSMSYDIIKAHGGEIRVETKEGEFTEFVVQIPEI